MRVRLRKHLFEELLDLEFALRHFLSGKGGNKDFARMNHKDQEFWLLFIRVVSEQIKAYRNWLLTEHGRRDPHAERLSTIEKLATAYGIGVHELLSPNFPKVRISATPRRKTRAKRAK